MRIKHAFTNPKADGADATIVRPSNWNADHTIYGEFDTLALMLADTTQTYSNTSAGEYIRTRAEGFSYKVAASGASDQHLTTAGGLKLYVQPSNGYVFDFDAFNPYKDGSTDDYAILMTAINASKNFESSTSRHGPALMLRSGTYYISQTINLKHPIRLMGHYGGQQADAHAVLKFPTGVTGLIVNRHNTLDDGLESPSTGSADGAVIEGIKFFGSGGTDRTKHGIWLRARAVVRNCAVAAFSGNGINIVAACSGGTQPAIEGNANCWELTSCTITACHTGVYVDSDCPNAGLASGLDCTGNTTWGVYDSSFLGNTYVGCHFDVNGGSYSGSGTSAFCSYLGNTYQMVPGATEAEAVATTPGTDDTVWNFIPGLNYPLAWTGADAEGKFRLGGPFYTDNVNCRAIFIGCYTELGQGEAYLSISSMVIGGMSALYTSGGANLFCEGDLLKTKTAVVSTNDFITSTLGGEDSSNVLAWNYVDDANSEWRLQYEDTRNNWNVKVQNSTAVLTMTGVNTTSQFGTGAAVPYQLHAPAIALGDLGAGDSRRITYGSGPPGSGARARGDIVFSFAPTAGEHVGWLCTSGGTPGTWVKFGNSELQNTATYDPPSLAAGTVDTIQTMTVTGAALGDLVDVSFSLDLQGIQLRAWVSASNTVKYVFSCPAGGATVDLGSGTVKCRIRK